MFISCSKSGIVKYEQFGDDQEHSGLSLNSDKTFRLNHYNNRSCWTWYTVDGTWREEKGKTIFTNILEWEEESILIDTMSNPKSPYIIIKVKTNLGQPVENFVIGYNHKCADSTKTYRTDIRGEIKISKKIFLKEPHYDCDTTKAFLEVNPGFESGNAAMNTSVAIKYNVISLIIVNNPKHENIIRQTVYKKEGKKLYFESQTNSVDKGFGVMNWGNFIRVSRK